MRWRCWMGSWRSWIGCGRNKSKWFEKLTAFTWSSNKLVRNHKTSLSIAPLFVCLKRSYSGGTETGEGAGFCVILLSRIFFGEWKLVSGGLRSSNAMVDRELEGFVLVDWGVCGIWEIHELQFPRWPIFYVKVFCRLNEVCNPEKLVEFYLYFMYLFIVCLSWYETHGSQSDGHALLGWCTWVGVTGFWCGIPAAIVRNVSHGWSYDTRVLWCHHLS